MGPRPDERLEAFHIWTNVKPRRRWRIHWPSVAIWGGMFAVAVAFWIWALSAVVPWVVQWAQ